MPVKLAVFDMAGTTVSDDNAVANAFRTAFEVYGFSVKDDDINPLMGYKKPDAIQIMLERKRAKFDEELMDDIQNELETLMLDHYEYSPNVKPLPGVEAVL